MGIKQQTRSSSNPMYPSIDIKHPAEHFGKTLRAKGGRKITAEGEGKIAWLCSQLVGAGVEIDTPFGRRLLTYADHTASGRSIHYIENYILRKVLPFYGNTHTDDSYVGDKMTKMMHDASAYIKECMGGGPDDALIFCGSGTTAAIKRLQEVLGIAASSTARERLLGSLRAGERWVVFVGPYEHHSNLLSWRQSLAEVVEIGADGEGQVDVEALRRELQSPRYADRPMLGSFSACSNVTGIRTDTRALARLLHRHGAFACFDFAASGPYVEIDMCSGDREGYDAVFLSPHKFVGGPGTPGILLMNKVLYRLNSSPPSTCGGGTVSYVNGFDDEATLYYEGVEEREDAGTPPIIQKLRAALAFWVKEYVGFGLIDLRESVFIHAALKRLLPNPNIFVLGNTHVERQAVLSFLVSPNAPGGGGGGGGSTSSSSSSGDEMGVYAWGEGGGGVEGRGRSKPLHGRFVAKLLNDLFGIQARGGCACAGPYGHRLLGVDDSFLLALRSAILKGHEGLKPGWTRVSFCYYMSKEEFAFLLAAIEFVAANGHRFLPLYHFNWQTGGWSFRKRALKYRLMREEVAAALSDLSLTSPGSGGGMPTERPGSAGTGSPREEEEKEETEEEDVDDNDGDDAKKKFKGSAVGKFASYLETAKRMASGLPEQPQHARKVPDDIDADLVLFRI